MLPPFWILATAVTSLLTTVVEPSDATDFSEPAACETEAIFVSLSLYILVLVLVAFLATNKATILVFLPPFTLPGPKRRVSKIFAFTFPPNVTE